MQDRINWSDEQWAEHLEIPVTQLFQTRNSVKDKYLVDVVRSGQNQKNFTVALYEVRTLPSGLETRQIIATAPKEYTESAAALRYANTEFLPNLEMTNEWSRITHLPKRALQLLANIRER